MERRAYPRTDTEIIKKVSEESYNIIRKNQRLRQELASIEFQLIQTRREKESELDERHHRA